VELRTQDQHRLVGRRELIMILLAAALTFINFSQAEEPSEAIQETRSSISEAERRQREAMAHLFSINQRIKDIAKKKARLNDKLMTKEAEIREAAQDVNELEDIAGKHKDMLNQRLRRLYQGRTQSNIQWLFTAQTPVEIERQHRFLKRMVDSDHKQVTDYLSQLENLKKKRKELNAKVSQMVQMQKGMQGQERELAEQMGAKSRLVSQLRKLRDSNLSKLKSLRGELEGADSDYAFFERRGSLRPPVEARIGREYGTFVDPQFRFKLMHKGNFYATTSPVPVAAVFTGKVVLANQLPGYGRTVVIDHGDNYYTVYAFASELKVREGARVNEGDTIAFSGHDSPLFGPGLYFEIRHFTDAVDPRPWIKEPGIKTAAKEAP
jgi:septal ring factor EnvC (AmiA/AmiB activator)